MIVQCNKCLTKFKIDDEKIKGKIVRIRCARCHQPFTVQGEELEETKESTDEGHEAVNAALNTIGQNTKAPQKGGTAENNPASPSLETRPGHKDLSSSDEANGLDKNIAAGKPQEDFSTAGASDLSIGAPLDETHSSADPSGATPSGENPSGENPSSNDRPSVDKDAASGKEAAIGLNSDAVSVDGEDGEEYEGQEQPETDTAPSDDLDLDFSEDASDDEGEFIPDNAPLEEIIEDNNNEDGLDLGISTGVVIDPEPDQDSKDSSSESSIEDTLEESGFGFSLDEPQDDTETDFTKDIDEFPKTAESEETEFNTELPDLSSGFDSELDSALKEELADKIPSKRDSAEDLGIEDLTDESSNEDALPEKIQPEEIQKDADSEPGYSPETSETNTTDDNKDEFNLTEEDETADSTDDEFAVITEPTPDEDNKDDNDEVFKGFADDLEEDAACNTYEAGPANESQEKAPNQSASPEDTTPYADKTQDSAPTHEPPEPYDNQYEEPAQENYNHEPPLPFETPSSPKPDMTFTPQPAIESSDNYSAPATNHAKSKGNNSKWLPIIVLAIIVYGGIAALYSTGIIGQPQVSQTELTPIRVERIRGIFIKNKEMGRIFAIEGRIRNFSEEPQGIRMIRGVLKDGQGRIIAAKKVTPGKIISKEALKTVSKNNLRKQLNGVPGGSIPPKGSIPVMIVFTKLPKGFAGAGVEIYRR